MYLQCISYVVMYIFDPFIPFCLGNNWWECSWIANTWTALLSIYLSVRTQMLILRSRVLRQRKYFIFSIFTTFYLLVLLLKQETSPALPLLQHVSDPVSPELINIPSPADYDEAGCPRVPIAFSGMTGRLGNMISTYVNFIALQWKLGYRYHLPQHSDSREYIQAWISLVEMVHSVAEGSLSAPARKWTNG